MSTSEKEALRKQLESSVPSKIRGPLKKDGSALVVLSGGQDSTTSLYWAMNNFDHVTTLFFNYGQRHLRAEEKAAFFVCQKAKVPFNSISIPFLKEISKSALVNPDMNVSETHPIFPNLPATFVPLRNQIMLTIAASFAVNRGIKNLVTGVCQTDYSGYPDCRLEFILTLQDAVNKALDIADFKIWTPLMHLTKAETVVLADLMPGCMEALHYSHTCYEGEVPPCGKCPACILRAKGFDAVGIKDPLYWAG